MPLRKSLFVEVWCLMIDNRLHSGVPRDFPLINMPFTKEVFHSQGCPRSPLDMTFSLPSPVCLSTSHRAVQAL